jgi:hypothetical protein
MSPEFQKLAVPLKLPSIRYGPLDRSRVRVPSVCVIDVTAVGIGYWSDVARNEKAPAADSYPLLTEADLKDADELEVLEGEPML